MGASATCCDGYDGFSIISFIFYPLPVLKNVWPTESFLKSIPASLTVKLNANGEDDHPGWLPVSFFSSLTPAFISLLFDLGPRSHSPKEPFSNCVTWAECFWCMAGIQAVCWLHSGWLAERPERASRIHSLQLKLWSGVKENSVTWLHCC